MFIGGTAPYRNLSSTKMSLGLKVYRYHNDTSTPTAPMDCSIEQGLPNFLSSNSCTTKRQISQGENDADDIRRISKTFLNLADPMHQESINKSCFIKGFGVGQSCIVAMFSPVIRAYPPPHARSAKSGCGLGYLRASPFLEHIDITTVWKGLMLSDAEKLLNLHQAFRNSLEDLLADGLQKMRNEFLKLYSNLDARLLDKASLLRRLPFSRSQLIHCMSQRLKPVEGGLVKGSRRYYSVLLPLYLISCDCFMDFEGDGVGDTAVGVRLSYRDPSTHSVAFGPVNDIAWVPDMLTFNDIHEIQREGQELIIIPRYNGNAAHTTPLTHNKVHFAIESSQPWLSWDKSISGFRGNVPMYSERGGCSDWPEKVYGAHPHGPYATTNTLRVEIKALLNIGYGSRIRFERTIRVRLTFKIVPWYAHDSACAPSDDFVRPFAYSYPVCASPSHSSNSSKTEVELAQGNIINSIAVGDVDGCLSSQNSHTSAGLLPAAQGFGPPPMSPRKRRATSSLRVPSPIKRHRECDDKQHVSDVFDQYNKDCFKSSIEEPAKCGSNSTTSDEQTSNSIPTLRYFNPSSFRRSNLQPSSTDEDGLAEVKHLQADVGETQPFHEVQFDFKNANPVYPRYGVHEESGDEASCPREETSSNEQKAPPTNISLDELAETDDVSHSTGPKGKDLHKPKSTRKISSPLSEAINDLLDSPSGKSCKDSIMTEIIIENPDVDPGLRRQQAILWRALSAKEESSKMKGETMSMEELRDLYATLKLSAKEGEERESVKLGQADLLDDIFMASGNSTDDSDEAPSVQENSEALGGVESGSEYSVQELAFRINYSVS